MIRSFWNFRDLLNTCRHSRESGNPAKYKCIFGFTPLDSRLRGNDVPTCNSPLHVESCGIAINQKNT